MCRTVKVVDSFVTELGFHEVGTKPRYHVDAGGVVAEGLATGRRRGGEEEGRREGEVSEGRARVVCFKHGTAHVLCTAPLSNSGRPAFGHCHCQTFLPFAEGPLGQLG